MTPEEIIEYKKQNYIQNKEEIKERSKQWTKDHPEEKHQQNMLNSEKKTQWVIDNPEKRAAAIKKYNDNNRAKVNAANRKTRKTIKDSLYKILGGYVCSCIDENCSHVGKCGVTDERALQLGHKLDDGAKERKGGINRDKFYRFYVAQPQLAIEKIEVTCANCNTIKEYERRQSLVERPKP